MADLTSTTQAYPWFDDTMIQWSKRVQTGMVPHAVLLHGPQGIGKMDLALTMAQTLLCQQAEIERRPCRQCQACEWFQAGTHPDFALLQPEEKSEVIKIEQVRELCQSMTLTSHAGQYKVTIVVPAEAMNRNAANAFLKTLEEPVANTIFILVSHVPGLVPVTIRSRCQALALSKPSHAIAKQWLAQYQIKRDDYFLSLAEGSPLIALDYAKNSVDKVHDTVMEDLLAFVVDKKKDCTQIAESWIKLDTQRILSWQLNWVNQLIRQKLTRGASADTQKFVSDRLILLNKHLDLSLLFRVRDKLLHTLYLVKTSVNKQLMFESLLASWRGLEN